MRGYHAIPRAALFLGVAGLLPFYWGLVTLWVPALERATLVFLGPRFVGPHVGLQYGTVILSFMSGVLWGFATRAANTSQAAKSYVLSTLPALWVFFMVGGGAHRAALALITGFALLLLLDLRCARLGEAPGWWLTLRLLLTAGVLLALLPIAL